MADQSEPRGLAESRAALTRFLNTWGAIRESWRMPRPSGRREVCSDHCPHTRPRGWEGLPSGTQLKEPSWEPGQWEGGSVCVRGVGGRGCSCSVSRGTTGPRPRARRSGYPLLFSQTLRDTGRGRLGRHAAIGARTDPWRPSHPVSHHKDTCSAVISARARSVRVSMETTPASWPVPSTSALGGICFPFFHDKPRALF